MRLVLGLLLAAGIASPAWCDTPEALTMGECAANGAGARLQLTVDGLHSAKGDVMVVIYGSRPSAFLAKGKWVVKVQMPIAAATITGCIALPKPGTYAIAVYHDEDSNRHLKRTLIGLPAEGYAFSNNPHSLLGLPSYRSVAFSAKDTVTPVLLHIRYP
jgi:uncharacterized protein (DUF2141 family)